MEKNWLFLGPDIIGNSDGRDECLDNIAAYSYSGLEVTVVHRCPSGLWTTFPFVPDYLNHLCISSIYSSPMIISTHTINYSSG